MKTLLLSAATVLAVAGGAFAMTPDQQTRDTVANTLDSYNFNVGVSTLTDDQVNLIYGFTELHDQKGERARILKILDDAGYQHMQLGEEMIFVKIDSSYLPPANSLRDEVGIKLGDYGFDNVDTHKLSDDQVAKLYTIVQNSDTEAARAAIQTVLQ